MSQTPTVLVTLRTLLYTKLGRKCCCASGFVQTFYGGSSDPGGLENIVS